MHATTGSPDVKLMTGPGSTKSRSVNDAPRLVERATPLKLRPPVPNTRVSRTLPESL